MKLKFVIALIICMIATSVDAQEISTNGIDIGVYRGKYRVRSRTPVDRQNISYSPYLHKEPKQTEIIMLSGDTVSGQYRYNIETETLEHFISDKIVPWNLVKSFSFDAHDSKNAQYFSNLQLVWPGNEYGGFIQDVKSSPFVKVVHYLEFVPKNYDPTNEIGSHVDRILPFKTRYLKVNDKWVELPDIKSSFYDMFGTMSDALRKQARKNKWRYKNLEDVGKMVSWVVKNRN